MGSPSLFVTTWLWGDKWEPAYAARLFRAVRRNLKAESRLILVADKEHNAQAVGADRVVLIPEEDRPLRERPGCLARMRIFDRGFQRAIGAQPGDRIVNIDVDAVVVGELDPLFERDDEFAILQHVNQTNPCPFNGSLWSFRAGERADVWEDFSFENYRKLGVPVHSIPDDQGWLHFKFPNAAAFTSADGVYAFKKIGWPGHPHNLPAGARVVAFPGRDPKKFQWLRWVREHWGGNVLITPDYVVENTRLHQIDPAFGAEGYLWAYTVAGIARIEQCQTVLDYGCGKGSLARALTGLDLMVAEYDPAVSGKDQTPGGLFDLVVALDVLEHVEPDCIGDVVEDLARLAHKCLFVVISTKPSKRKLSDGRDSHLLLKDDNWWRSLFCAHGFSIRRVFNTGLRALPMLLSPPGK